MAETEGTAQVGETFGTAEESLLVGVADAAQSVLEAESAQATEGLGDFVGLVEPAPLLSTPVKRNGNEDPGRIALRRNARVIPNLLREDRKFAMEVKLAPILVGMHELAGLVVRTGCRAGELEGELAPARVVDL